MMPLFIGNFRVAVTMRLLGYLLQAVIHIVTSLSQGSLNVVVFTKIYTVEPLYNTIVFHQNTHKRHPIARP